MNQTDLKHKLSAPFDFNEWKNILAQMFPKIDYLAKETSVDNNLVKNGGQIGVIHLTYIIHSGFISGYQNRYGDNLKPPTNVYHRMTA